MKIGITGYKGFVGTALLNRSSADLKFVPLDLQTSTDIETNLGVSEKLEHIIHLAAKTSVPKSWQSPVDFYASNVMGTLSVLELCRKHQCGLTYVSSYVYGVPHYLPIDELHPVSPNTPYNHSKLMGEEVCAFYSKNFGIDVAVIRPFNIYGPNQNKVFLIPEIVNQILNSPEIVLQSLEPKRDFLYIEDFMDALIATINFKGYDVFNLGSGVSYSVKEILDMLMKTSSCAKPIKILKTERPNEVMDVVANASKFKTKFNWLPNTDIYSGLTKTLMAESEVKSAE